MSSKTSGPWRNRYERCAAPGCFKPPRKFSRYCRHHYAKLERTRSLRGRVVTKGELKANRADCLEFIRRNAEHPAVVAALRYMADLIEPTPRAGFLVGEFARLRAAGATPEAMLASAMALYMWAERGPEWNRLEDRTFNLNLGRAVLNTVPAARKTSRNGKPYYVRVRPGH